MLTWKNTSSIFGCHSRVDRQGQGMLVNHYALAATESRNKHCAGVSRIMLPWTYLYKQSWLRWRAMSGNMRNVHVSARVCARVHPTRLL